MAASPDLRRWRSRWGATLAIPILCGLLPVACTDYDVDRADTPANRQGFAKHLGFEPGGDVTEVYYYADEFGADVRYQLRFRCPERVAERVIAGLSLAPESDRDSGLDPRDDLLWWQPGSTVGLPMWRREAEDGQRLWEFWFSEEGGLAYYHEYTL